jgi:hypothetical protein
MGRIGGIGISINWGLRAGRRCKGALCARVVGWRAVCGVARGLWHGAAWVVGVGLDVAENR